MNLLKSNRQNKLMKIKRKCTLLTLVEKVIKQYFNAQKHEHLHRSAYWVIANNSVAVQLSGGKTLSPVRPLSLCCQEAPQTHWLIYTTLVFYCKYFSG